MPSSTSEAPAAATLGPFCRELVRQVRARDGYGLHDGRPDGDLLAPFVVDKVKARAIPIIGDPDPAVLERVRAFYAAIALAVEKRCGLMASPLISIGSEGFGRAVLICGRLVLVSKTLRDVHRFGFADLARLESAGSALVESALAAIAEFNAAATAE
jgi:probable nitrogen fixation protein